eukprot:1256365-Amphidinium_carterae.1
MRVLLGGNACYSRRALHDKCRVGEFQKDSPFEAPDVLGSLQDAEYEDLVLSGSMRWETQSMRFLIA